ncbi:MAG: lipid-binding SYLF domain-containing protein [Acidobacteriia bacterium]|nr:lipid-binding SYLF domain-containing protein [Terriglobia bacterium]
MRAIVAAAASFVISTSVMLADTAQERLKESADIFQEIMATPDKGIPQDLLNRAQCVVVVPNMKKAAFVVGGQYGRGFAMCRNTSGTGWGAPAAVRLEGGSVGFQIGASSTDLVMLVMNKHGMEKLLQDKFTIGADASAAAGPVGRTAGAETNARMDAEILAWSRAKGLFAGISLNGATMRPDMDENATLYGRRLNSREVIMSDMKPPAAAQPLISELDRYSMRSNTGGAARSVDHDHDHDQR